MNIDSSARAPFGRTETRLQPAEAKVQGDNGYNILPPPQVKSHQQPRAGSMAKRSRHCDDKAQARNLTARKPELSSEPGRQLCGCTNSLSLETPIGPRAAPQSPKGQTGAPQTVQAFLWSALKRVLTRTFKCLNLNWIFYPKFFEATEMAFYRWQQLTKDVEPGRTLPAGMSSPGRHSRRRDAGAARSLS